MGCQWRRLPFTLLSFVVIWNVFYSEIQSNPLRLKEYNRPLDQEDEHLWSLFKTRKKRTIEVPDIIDGNDDTNQYLLREFYSNMQEYQSMQNEQSKSQLQNDVQSLRHLIAQLSGDEEREERRKFSARTSEGEEESKMLSVVKREVNDEEEANQDAEEAERSTTPEKGEVEIIEQNGETVKPTVTKVITKPNLPSIKQTTAAKVTTKPNVPPVKPTTAAKIATEPNVPPVKPTTAAKDVNLPKVATKPKIVTVKPTTLAKASTKPKIDTKPPPPIKPVTVEKVITETKNQPTQKPANKTGAVNEGVPLPKIVEKPNDSGIVSIDTLTSVDELCNGDQCVEISVPLGRNKDAVWALGSLTFLLLLLTGAVLYTGLWKKRHGKLKRWQKADRRDSLSVAALLRKKSSRSAGNGHYANGTDNNLSRITEEDSTDEDDVI